MREALKITVAALKKIAGYDLPDESAMVSVAKQAITAAEEALAQPEQEPVEVWRDDAPPKRGVYRVKRGAQRGFSYWNGERWGMLCSSRPYAVEIRDMGRKTPSKYPMYWLHKTAHGVKE